MKTKLCLLLPVVLGALALTGCSNESAQQVNLNLRYLSANQTPADIQDVNANAQMVSTASDVDQSLRQLSAIQIAKNPSIKIQSPSEAGGLLRRASLDWDGPVGQVVAHVAKASGYRLRVLGTPPTIAVIVDIRSKNKTLGEILQNIKFQAAPTVTIRTDVKKRVIELRYNKK